MIDDSLDVHDVQDASGLISCCDRVSCSRFSCFTERLVQSAVPSNTNHHSDLVEGLCTNMGQCGVESLCHNVATVMLGHTCQEVTPGPRVVVIHRMESYGCDSACLLQATRLGITTVISTDSIRHMLRSFHSKESSPLLWASTYQAGEAINPDKGAEVSTE